MKKTRFLLLFFSVLFFNVYANVGGGNQPLNKIIIANEGNYGKPNAEASMLDLTTGKITNGIYNTANGENLGDVLQNVGVYGDNAYLVVNNSNKIVIVDRKTFKKKAVITNGIKQPRYITFTNNKYYVTNSAPKNVTVYNISDNKLVATIAINTTVEKITSLGNKVFVSNGAWGSGKTFKVIDATTDKVTKTITVDNGINSLVSDGTYLYALSGGKDGSHLYKYDPKKDMKLVVDFSSDKLKKAKKMCYDKGNLYFVANTTKLYALSKDATAFNTTEFATVANNSWSTLYGFKVIENIAYTSDVQGFVKPSKIITFNVKTGVKLATYTAGMGTNNFYRNINGGHEGSYSPQVGIAGSTGISATDSKLIAWAKEVTVTRGFKDIKNPSDGKASVGEANNAVGKSNGQLFSLGDGGVAIVTFNKPIKNGEGVDFAIFENGFVYPSLPTAFLELAFVEVSSNGVDYFRFPAVTEQSPTEEIGGFGTLDASKLHNFAGKHLAGYGTPFDLSEVPDNPKLNKNAITHVKIIDVVGTKNPTYATHDSKGNIVIDPYPTPFASSGFDLEAVGVIHQNTSLHTDKIISENNLVQIYPNPAKNQLKIKGIEVATVTIYNLIGKELKQINYTGNAFYIGDLSPNIYLIKVKTATATIFKKVVKQ